MDRVLDFTLFSQKLLCVNCQFGLPQKIKTNKVGYTVMSSRLALNLLQIWIFLVPKRKTAKIKILLLFYLKFILYIERLVFSPICLAILLNNLLEKVLLDLQVSRIFCQLGPKF